MIKVVIMLVVLFFMLCLYICRRTAAKEWEILLYKSVFIAIGIELFIFNFRHWESLAFPAEIKVNLEEMTFSKELNENVVIMNGEYWLDIEIANIDQVTKNLYVDFEFVDQSGLEIKKVMPIRIKNRDTGHELYRENRVQNIYNDIEKNRYVRLNFYEITKSVSFAIENTEKAYGIRINEVKFNTTVPFFISYVRMSVLTAICMVFLVIQSKSGNFELQWDKDFRGRKLILYGTMVGLCILIVFMTNINPRYSIEKYYTQYHKLAEALLEGKVYLKDIPAPSLVEMENPYDNAYRSQILKEAGESYFIDYALYEGKYYVYFGILPVLLFFLPYYAITQSHISDQTVISICGILLVVAVFLLVKSIIKKWFKGTSFLNYMLASTLLIVGSGLFYAFHGAQHYAIPLLLAAVLSVFGLYFWISSIDEKNELDYSKVFLGSLCVALTALSRPQFLIVAVFALIIYAPLIKERNPFISRKKVNLMLVGVMPFIVIGIVTMYYNYIRFGSVFDFGANYNLTSNDMTSRGIHFDRTFLGFFYYLFEPTTITVAFPFIAESTVVTNYMGGTITETLTGGYLFTHPFMWITLFTGNVKKYFKEKQVYCFGIVALISACLIVFADTQMAGIISRYIMDFGWLLCIAGLLIFFTLYEQVEMAVVRSGLQMAVYGTIVISVLYEFLLLFQTRTYLHTYNEYMWYVIKSIMQFW